MISVARSVEPNSRLHGREARCESVSDRTVLNCVFYHFPAGKMMLNNDIFGVFDHVWNPFRDERRKGVQKMVKKRLFLIPGPLPISLLTPLRGL